MTKELLSMVKIVTKVSFFIIWKYFHETDELLSIKDLLAISRMLGFPFLSIF
jgi:hypothetical protein